MTGNISGIPLEHHATWSWCSTDTILPYVFNVYGTSQQVLSRPKAPSHVNSKWWPSLSETPPKHQLSPFQHNQTKNCTNISLRPLNWIKLLILVQGNTSWYICDSNDQVWHFTLQHLDRLKFLALIGALFLQCSTKVSQKQQQQQQNNQCGKISTKNVKIVVDINVLWSCVITAKFMGQQLNTTTMFICWRVYPHP